MNLKVRRNIFVVIIRLCFKLVEVNKAVGQLFFRDIWSGFSCGKGLECKTALPYIHKVILGNVCDNSAAAGYDLGEAVPLKHIESLPYRGAAYVEHL